MYRLIDDYLENWTVNPHRKPLILRGARQTGKTYAVKKLAGKKFKYFIHLNFERYPELTELFVSSKDPQHINRSLSAYFSVPVIPGETLLFLDEVQNSPEAIAALWHYYEELPELHVIAAGSLLDFTLNKLPYSMPVGRVEFAYMYPMTFVEFLYAMEEKGLADYLPNYWPGTPFPAALHKKLLDLLRYYYFVGGMPEAVKTFVRDGDLQAVEKIQENIITSFQYDFAKYGTKKQQQLLREVMRFIARNPGKEITYAKINPHEHSKVIKSALYKLEMSRIIHLVRKTSAAGIPLEQYADEDKFKAVFLDIGLANRLTGIRLTDLTEIITEGEGALAEQFAGQELIATWNPPYIDTKLYYWKRDVKNSNAEIDYLLQWGNEVLPLEIKAGKAGRLRSLHVFMALYHKGLGIRLYTGLPRFDRNLQASVRLKNTSRRITYDLLSLPQYFTGFLKNILENLRKKSA